MRIRVMILIAFGMLALISALSLPKLQFSFSFEQFFPKDDPDLAFFNDFIKEFETDDNFLLIAVRREQGVFEQAFLKKFHDFTLQSRTLPHVVQSTSLTKIGYPVKTPFAITTIPAIHINEPERYDDDRKRILQDERFVYNLIAEDAKTLVLFLKMVDGISLEQSNEFMAALEKLAKSYHFESYHFLGRAYFQKELVAMQIREVTVSAVVAGILVTIIFFFIFRRFWGVVIANVSIVLGMLLFMGFMAIFGRELNAMSALYPVLMIIVGTSDVIHIMSKYVDELRQGLSREKAIIRTIREIGLATLLTSVTTAIGFASLLTNRVMPIRDFGINAAVGVMIAFATVIFFTTTVLSMFSADQIIKIGNRQAKWDEAMLRLYHFTKNFPKRIAFGALVVLAICAWGISRINTNYGIIDNMPIGYKITEDFKFFERELASFRPLELAAYIQNGYDAQDFKVIQEIDKVENYLRTYDDIRAIGSITTVYKSINQMYNNSYELPSDEAAFETYQRLLAKVPQMDINVLVSQDQQKARITSRVRDVGADTLKAMNQRINQWIQKNVDTSLVKFRLTGTGLMIDKNAEYIRRNLLLGLGMAVLIIGGLMTLLFFDLKMLLISLVPNIFPLLIGAAFLGFTGVELEAGISIIFSVIFGIAVDDTIHFLSKFKLVRQRGMTIENAIRTTFLETGKPIVLTTVLLFFGFLVMLFSVHPPSVTVGWLISLILATALVCDLLMLPVLIRWLLKD